MTEHTIRQLSDPVERFQTLGGRLLGLREGDAVQRHGEARLSAGLSLEAALPQKINQ